MPKIVSFEETSEDDFDVLASRATEPSFYRAPHPDNVVGREYQHAGVEYALARNHCLIGDAPGVGKTAQGIMVSNAIGAKRTLVICPASLRLNWERQIRTWSMVDGVSTYPIMRGKDGVNLDADYVIISYDLCRNTDLLAALLSVDWDHMILDEAHSIKSSDAKRMHTICGEGGIAEHAGRMSLLSGTIMPNQPSEVYNAVRLLDWGAINKASQEDFMAHYYDYGEGFVFGPVEKYDSKGGAYIVRERHWSNRVRNVPRNLADLEFRLRSRLMVRRLKSQVLKELPPKQWHPFPLATTPEMRKAMKHPGWAEAEALYAMDPNGFGSSMPVDGAISTARRELAEAKAPAVVDYIEELLEEGVTKLLVAPYHRSTMAYYREHLEKHGIVVMDSSTSMIRRQAAVDQFATDDRIKICVGQMLVMGEGTDGLQVAQDAVIPEPFWVPGKLDQLLDRLHRFGQTGNVIGHIPVVPGTLDEEILSVCIGKEKNIVKALDARFDEQVATRVPALA